MEEIQQTSEGREQRGDAYSEHSHGVMNIISGARRHLVRRWRRMTLASKLSFVFVAYVIFGFPPLLYASARALGDSTSILAKATLYSLIAPVFVLPIAALVVGAKSWRSARLRAAPVESSIGQNGRKPHDIPAELLVLKDVKAPLLQRSSTFAADPVHSCDLHITDEGISSSTSEKVYVHIPESSQEWWASDFSISFQDVLGVKLHGRADHHAMGVKWKTRKTRLWSRTKTVRFEMSELQFNQLRLLLPNVLALTGKLELPK